MSDKPEGPGWWIASDGNWYPPELHPSVREGSRMQSPVDTPVQPIDQVVRTPAEVTATIGVLRTSTSVTFSRLKVS